MLFFLLSPYLYFSGKLYFTRTDFFLVTRVTKCFLISFLFTLNVQVAWLHRAYVSSHHCARHSATTSERRR